ncbi:MAG: hemin uptake protein HemP [Gammaproteobacteria bacterium]
MSERTEETASIREPKPLPVDVRKLFKGRKEIELVYLDERYRLRITRNKKLILTK